MPPMSQKTKTGSAKLSDQAKHLVVPADIVSTGWPAVRKTCVEKLGAEFDPWQDGAGRVILAKRVDGTLAAMVDGVGMSLPRQVGKTHLIGYLVFALCVNIPGLLVIWTAHHSATSGETFLSMQGFAQRAKVAPHVKQVYTGSGDEEVRFHNGSRILFGARERGFGRGIPGVDVLIFDEAQILSDKAMSNMLATLNTSQFGLQLYIGTPPKPEDNSEAFKQMRREALAGTLIDGAWIEFGADADADGEDRKQWRKANPSHPKRTPVQSMLRMKRKLTKGDWLREGLGIWDTDQVGSSAIAEAEWDATGVDEAPADGVRSFAVAFSFDGTRLALTGGLKHDDGIHVELIDAAQGDVESGLSALADWLTERWRNVAVIVLSGAAGAPVLAQLLKDRKVPDAVVKIVTTAEYTQACSVALDAVRESAAIAKRNAELEQPESLPFTHLAHEGQSQLDESVLVCDKKQRGTSGAWGWSATTPDGDETPTEAMSLAYWAAKTTRRKPRGDRERKAVVFR
jgi:hypothetical protein